MYGGGGDFVSYTGHYVENNRSVRKIELYKSITLHMHYYGDGKGRIGM